MENTNIRELLSDLVMIPSISSLDENQKDVLDSANYIADLFNDEDRFLNFSAEACQLCLDFSKTNIDQPTLELLINLAKFQYNDTGLGGWINHKKPYGFSTYKDLFCRSFAP